MSARSHLSVKRKLVLLTFLTTSVAVLLAGCIYTLYQFGAIRDTHAREFSLLADVLAAQGRIAIDTRDDGALEPLLEQLRARGAVAAHVDTRDGRRVGGFGDALHRVAAPGEEPGARTEYDDGRVEWTRPIRAGGRDIGAAYVAADPADVYRRLGRQALVGALVMVLSFAVAWLAARRVQQTIATPIQTLTASAAAPAIRALCPARERVDEGDELPRLVAAFDALVSGLEDRDAALSTTRASYRALFENVADPVYLIDGRGLVLDANPAACREVGFEYDDLTGMHFSAFDPSWPARALAPEWAAALANGPATLTSEHVRRDTTRFPVEIRLTAFHDPDGERFVAVARDISDRARVAALQDAARRAAESASEVKTRFLASINHEIRTPMTAIVSMTALLGRTALDDEQSRFVEILDSSTSSLLNVIDDILELAWIDSGRSGSDSLDFEPAAVMEETLDVFAQRARGKSIELVSSMAAGVPRMLRGDPRHLRQVLIHLIGNAVKFTDHGEIELRVRTESHGTGTVELRFEVRDTGIGVPAELQRELFEPFVKNDAPGARRGGAGIGLAIARSMVDLMDGEIGVRDNDAGGATFWFTARLADTESEETTAAAAALEGVELLVVDRNPTVARCAGELLENAGARVDVADFERPESLAAALVERPYRAVLLGLSPLPEGETVGAEAGAARMIATAAREASIGVGLLVPLGDAPAPSIAALADARLTKPVRQSGLIGFVTGLVDPQRPESAPIAARHAVGIPSSAARGGERARVLVVDDDDAVRTSMSLVVESLGYDCATASSGREALRAIAACAFDAVVLDCQMPEMDGCETTSAIREREAPGHRLPIVGMSGYLVDGEFERSRAADMDELLTKPISLALLESVLGQLVDANRESARTPPA